MLNTRIKYLLVIIACIGLFIWLPRVLVFAVSVLLVLMCNYVNLLVVRLNHTPFEKTSFKVAKWAFDYTMDGVIVPVFRSSWFINTIGNNCNTSAMVFSADPNEFLAYAQENPDNMREVLSFFQTNFKPCIIIQDDFDETSLRGRFIMSHEMGHIVLKHLDGLKSGIVNTKEISMANELEADKYAFSKIPEVSKNQWRVWLFDEICKVSGPILIQALWVNRKRFF